MTPYFAAKSASSAVYKTNNRGPKTEPSGTEHVTRTVAEVLPPYMTQYARQVRLEPFLRLVPDSERVVESLQQQLMIDSIERCC